MSVAARAEARIGLLDRFLQRIVRVEFLLHEAGMALNHRQNIVEIVRNACRQLADRLHLLRLAQLAFEQQVFSDILGQQQEMRFPGKLDRGHGNNHLMQSAALRPDVRFLIAHSFLARNGLHPLVGQIWLLPKE